MSRRRILRSWNYANKIF